MTDSDDIDAALQARASQGSAASSNGDDIESALMARANQKPAKTKAPETSVAEDLSNMPKTARNAVGAFVEPGMYYLSKGVAGVAGNIAGLGATAYDAVTGNPDTDAAGFKQDVENRLTYTPRTEGGAIGVKAADAAMGPVNYALDKVRQGGTYLAGKAGAEPWLAGPLGEGAAAAVPLAIPGAVAGVKGIGKVAGAAKGALSELSNRGVPSAAQAAVDREYSTQSQGAAANVPKISELPMEVQSEIATAAGNGSGIDTAAIERIHKASKLGVNLTEGEAKQNSALMSEEYNRKGDDGGRIGKRYEDTDNTLRAQIQDLHQENASSAIGHTESQHGQNLLDAEKRYDAPKKQAVDDAYAEARDMNKAAGNGDLRLDTKPAVEHANSVLEDREDLLPSEGKAILKRLRDSSESGDGISMQQFETFRTIVSRASRKYEMAGDGNAVHALGDVRDALERAEPSNATAPVKAKFDLARKLARDRFAEMDKNPSYKAAVNDEVPEGQSSDLADKFMSKYVSGAPRSALQRMRERLASDTDANHAITGHTFDQIRKQIETQGGLSQTGIDNAMRTLRNKPELINNPEALDKLSDIRDVSEWTRKTTRASTKNFSHTSHSMAERADSLVNSKLGKLGQNVLPMGRAAGDLVAEHAARARIDRALKPGAGIAK